MNTIRTKYPVLGFWDTRIGGRPVNQDSVGYADTPFGLLVMVCDGMGGGPGGEVASQLAVMRVAEYFKSLEHHDDLKVMMKCAIEYAHQSIIRKTEEEPQLRGMGTTIVAILFNKEIAVIGHVGDSRLYQFRRGRKIFRTKDHSLVAEMVRNKTLTEEQARLSGQSNVITRAMGGNGQDLAEVEERPYEKGDRFMLCSDGIWGALPEPELINVCAKTPSISGTVDGLVLNVNELGLRNGNHHDNLTIALLETQTDSIKKEPMRRSTLYILYGLLIVLAVSLLANLILYIKANRADAIKEQLEKTDQALNQSRKERDSLNLLVNTLNNKVTESKVREEVAKEEVKRAKDEVQQKAQEVQDANARANEAMQKAQIAEKAAQEASKRTQAKPNVPANLKSKIVEINTLLEKIKIKKEDKQRGQMRENAKKKLEALKKEDPKHKDIYQNVIEKLGNSRAKENKDLAIGHYNALIKELKNIIE